MGCILKPYCYNLPDMNDPVSKQIKDTHPDGAIPPTRMTCMEGQEVFKQGGPANQAFFIEEGLVEVVMEQDGHSVKLAEIGPGEIFGEMGVLEREVRMATVRALEKSTITVMSRDELELRIKNLKDPVISALINGFAKRLRATSAGQVQYYKNLAEFQNRVAGLMDKADEGIDQSKRAEFAAEIGPLLDQVEATLDKYRK